MTDLIQDLALILILAAVSTVVFRRLKLPVVLGYILAGFLASPYFSFLPNIVNEENIEFWAEIGVIFLLFSIGLEFSLKKLLQAGGGAFVTTLIMVCGMLGLGFSVGHYIMGFDNTNSIFLGGMLCTSSTSIILKTLTDLKMMHRRYVPVMFAVLIIEDLVAVVLLVILSSVAEGNVSSHRIVSSVLKLSFFLIIWFVVGIFLMPSIFKRFRRVISDESMLILVIGLCFMMALTADELFGSAELGAFVMGSILAGTFEVRRIERITAPIKDLFAAVFFISIGMMVNPSVIIANWSTILLLAVVVILGMIIFGTFGMLVTGQPLKLAIEAGFTLTQIGEFSFIIAKFGKARGVLSDDILPIIVGVSVITIFTTQYFIKAAEPFYNFVNARLPQRVKDTLDNYSRSADKGDRGEARQIWGTIIKRYLSRLAIYGSITVAVIWTITQYLLPVIVQHLGHKWGEPLCAVTTLFVISPFLYAIFSAGARRNEVDRLVSISGKVSYVPMVVMTVASMFVSLGFILATMGRIFPANIAILVSIGVFLAGLFIFRPVLKQRLQSIEQRFMGNVNVTENRRTGRDNNLVSDLHLAYMTVGYGCEFIGMRLRKADLRRRFNINLVNIEREGTLYPVPSGDTRILPSDILGVIGTDDQIMAFLPLVEAEAVPAASAGEAKFIHFELPDGSPIVGKLLRDARLREDYGALLVAVERDTDNTPDTDAEYLQPTPELDFRPGDILWIVGDPDRLKPLHNN